MAFRRWSVTKLRPASLSLKIRLGLLFTVLMLLAIAFAGSMLFFQYRASMRAADITVDEHTNLGRALELQEILLSIDRLGHNRELSTYQIDQFRKGVERLKAIESSVPGKEILHTVYERFEAYVSALDQWVTTKAETPALSPVPYDEVSAAVESFIDLKQESVYRLAHELKERQQYAIQVALAFLLLFLLLLMMAAFKVISVVTEPLTGLARFLDEVDIEGGIPSAAPALPWKLPEIERVSQSFQQLLSRLRGYQQINVKRLLLETRRADIIAASISDGIFLLRAEDVVYANPVGEKILGGAMAKGVFRLATEPDPGQRALSEDEARSRKVAASLRRALSSTIPVELEVVVDQRKFFFLLQAYSIPQEVVEQVEHSFDAPVDQLLDRWQGNSLVLARDVTLVKESQEAKSHFIATLSHEVKTPVTSLTMATRLLSKGLEQVPNPTHRALIETCTEDVNRLRVLIDDLLSVSRFDALTQRLERKEVDVCKLLKQSVQHFQPQAFEKGVEVTMSVEGGRRPIPVPMDAAKVSWALSNLLLNALRHTPRGGKVETVVSLHDQSVEIRIRDHGPGIQKNRQDRIFDKFNPFYDLRVARTGSVGMGLAIAREIIVAHGGRIWVISEPGRGAEFCFILPLKVEQQESGMTTLKGEPSGATARG